MQRENASRVWGGNRRWRSAIVLVVIALVATATFGAGSALSESALRCKGRFVTVNLALGESPTAGNDVILGTPGDDTVRALEGDDLICGLGGDDVLSGNQGNDFIYGGAGDDTLIGGYNDDWLFGEAGNDIFHNNRGEDRMYGGDGNDTFSGGRDRDRIFGQAGDDKINGRAGHDILKGGDGDDHISGSTGNDLLVGENGDDFLAGNQNNDTLQGGRGNDELHGGYNDDIVSGGTGDDILHNNRGVDEMDGGPGGDTCRRASGNDTTDSCWPAWTASVSDRSTDPANNCNTFTLRTNKSYVGLGSGDASSYRFSHGIYRCDANEYRAEAPAGELHFEFMTKLFGDDSGEDDVPPRDRTGYIHPDEWFDDWSAAASRTGDFKVTPPSAGHWDVAVTWADFQRSFPGGFDGSATLFRARPANYEELELRDEGWSDWVQVNYNATHGLINLERAWLMDDDAATPTAFAGRNFFAERQRMKGSSKIWFEAKIAAQDSSNITYGDAAHWEHDRLLAFTKNSLFGYHTAVSPAINTETARQFFLWYLDSDATFRSATHVDASGAPAAGDDPGHHDSETWIISQYGAYLEAEPNSSAGSHGLTFTPPADLLTPDVVVNGQVQHRLVRGPNAPGDNGLFFEKEGAPEFPHYTVGPTWIGDGYGLVVHHSTIANNPDMNHRDPNPHTWIVHANVVDAANVPGLDPNLDPVLQVKYWEGHRDSFTNPSLSTHREDWYFSQDGKMLRVEGKSAHLGGDNPGIEVYAAMQHPDFLPNEIMLNPGYCMTAVGAGSCMEPASRMRHPDRYATR